MLTKPQSRLLTFIAAYTAANGHGPTCRDMADYMGLKSKSGAVKLTNQLVQRGYLRKLPGHTRAVEVVKMPETMCGWQPIETAPKECVEFVKFFWRTPEIVVVADGRRYLTQWSDSLGRFVGVPPEVQPTHWLELPENPT
jgi:SOS-response transcriptional repressor LexA